MACEARLRPRQTVQERAEEIRRAIEKLARGLALGQVKPVVGKQGGIAFPGVDLNKDGISDACAYRKIMSGQNALAKLAIQKAEQLAGRGVSKEALKAGWHLHGDTWHKGH